MTNAAQHGATPNVTFNISAPAGYGNGSAKFADMDSVRTLGQLWRVGPDIWNYGDGKDPWNQAVDPNGGYNFGAYQSFDNTLELSRYQGPGTWNDADMLLIGDNGMTIAEERSQLALFSELAAPLVISTDARSSSPHTSRLIRPRPRISTRRSRSWATPRSSPSTRTRWAPAATGWSAEGRTATALWPRPAASTWS